MPLMLLQIDFKTDRPPSKENTDDLTQLAQVIANTPGLIWKIWTENPTTHEAGGIYLFEDEASLDTYLEVHTNRLSQMGISSINAKKFQVNTRLSEITKAILP